MYKIKNYTKQRALALGVIVKPSTNPKKKIDVYKNGVKVASIGDINYSDYPTYLEYEKNGLAEKGTAEKRKKLYKARHESDRHKRGSNGYYADQLLW